MATTKSRLSRVEKARLNRQSAERRAARAAEVAEALKAGCPYCGASIKRNLALAGWWQCSQFGAVGFRADSAKPQCDWQQFTD